MTDVISRRALRYLLFSIKNSQEGILDRNERYLVEKVRDEFEGYLNGPVGWNDFTTKWDISPGQPEEANMASRRTLSIPDWGAEIIFLWEWKRYLKAFLSLFGDKIVPPPCFTRQEKIYNGAKSNV